MGCFINFLPLKRIPSVCQLNATSLLLRNCTSTTSDIEEIRNSYRVLGVPDNSDQETVRIAFIDLVKRFHPDSKSTESDPVKFQEVEAAYRKLQDKFAHDRFNANEGLGEFGLYYEEKNEEIERPDIKHTAPQHRQYLSFGGIGLGTPSQREKQYTRYRAAKAVENVTQYRIDKLHEQCDDSKSLMKKSSKKKVKDIRTGFGMERLVEDLIQESMSRGDFDNLPGSGKPLRANSTTHNPYVDFITHKMNQVLIENGFTPMWITLQKDIRECRELVKGRLYRARATLGPLPLSQKELQYWAHVQFYLQDHVKEINKKIDSYNLIVPIMNKQMIHIDLEKEAMDILKNGPSKSIPNCSAMNPAEGQTGERKKSLRDLIISLFN